MTSPSTNILGASEKLAVADKDIEDDHEMSSSSPTNTVGASEKLAEADSVSKASSTGKQSVLILTLNVPTMNDGTNRSPFAGRQQSMLAKCLLNHPR